MKKLSNERLARELWENRHRWSSDDYDFDESDEQTFIRETIMALERNEARTA